MTAILILGIPLMLVFAALGLSNEPLKTYEIVLGLIVLIATFVAGLGYVAGKIHSWLAAAPKAGKGDA